LGKAADNLPRIKLRTSFLPRLIKTLIKEIVMSKYTNYNIQIDALLTWFPVRNSDGLKKPRIRMFRAKYNTDDQVFVVGNRIGTLNGQGLDNDDRLDDSPAYPSVVAFTDTGVNENEEFYTEFTVQIENSVKDLRLIFQPSTITPFLLNLRHTQEEDPEFNGTEVSFQGVVTASARGSDLIYIAKRVIGILLPKK
jgi:hypothetical protein